MSFLDNLENNLKALEGRDEFADPVKDQQLREAERARAAAAAPFAELLKSAPFTDELMRQATQAGYRVRTKVHIMWLGSILRLQARDRKLELRPTPEGVTAVFLEGNAEMRSGLVDMGGDPAELVNELLGTNQ